MATPVNEVRNFNRFYTRQIGVLTNRLSKSPFSLAEARVLYELANGGASTAADLSRILNMDKAHLSRMLSRFRLRGLIATEVSAHHAKYRFLSLTSQGQAAFAALDKAAIVDAERMLAPLDSADIARLTAAMTCISTILSKPTQLEEVTLRAPRPGDLSFVVHRQARLYAEEYGWDWTYEALISGIVSEFIRSFDTEREQVWIADGGHQIVGSVFLMKDGDPEVGRLRLLYVDAAMRGNGLGKQLVRRCIERARDIGYRKVTLWTNDILEAALHIYRAEGFRLVSEEPHRSFGHALNGQTWTLDL
ncbi:DNA-binding MarR family transcriptional regulator/GNAT superfamily N-acetyltransferase [Rhodoligotrophos appendicifer]|uniref:bifunctional helix-turn-helix transcriptional regulator/GNAT family N-acetyltransferase n=1 Tax=Rhodoligotrophos appendicifer TaxID=987056 RepID=UPI0011855CC7|nr:bifunctional helix-turn-helix transcriptional regulator/GNAT family N-acetyltransferase [Rhodoligotrophos appendicifer]